MPLKSGMVCGRQWPTPFVAFQLPLCAGKTRESQQGEKGDYTKKTNKLYIAYWEISQN